MRTATKVVGLCLSVQNKTLVFFLSKNLQIIFKAKMSVLKAITNGPKITNM